MAKSVLRKERDKLVAFYVSAAEKQIIINAANERDMSVSDYCRKSLLTQNDVFQWERAENVRTNS